MTGMVVLGKSGRRYRVVSEVSEAGQSRSERWQFMLANRFSDQPERELQQSAEAAEAALGNFRKALREIVDTAKRLSPANENQKHRKEVILDAAQVSQESLDRSLSKPFWDTLLPALYTLAWFDM